MSFWSAATMRRRIAAEGLVTPYDENRVVNGSYELSLGPEVYVTSAESKTKRAVAAGEQVEIPPGQFANLLTEESVSVPSDAIGLISVRFGLKKRGLVNVSGFHVVPGWAGRLLFSVYNAGPQSVVIARGAPVFLLWFVSFDEATDARDLYPGSTRQAISADDVMSIQGEIATPQALALRVASIESSLNVWRWIGRTIGAALIVAATAAIWSGVARLVDDDKPTGEPSPSPSSTVQQTSAPTHTRSS